MESNLHSYFPSLCALKLLWFITLVSRRSTCAKDAQRKQEENILPCSALLRVKPWSCQWSRQWSHGDLTPPPEPQVSSDSSCVLNSCHWDTSKQDNFSKGCPGFAPLALCVLYLKASVIKKLEIRRDNWNVSWWMSERKTDLLNQLCLDLQGLSSTRASLTELGKGTVGAHRR